MPWGVEFGWYAWCWMEYERKLEERLAMMADDDGMRSFA